MPELTYSTLELDLVFLGNELERLDFARSLERLDFDSLELERLDLARSSGGNGIGNGSVAEEDGLYFTRFLNFASFTL